MFFVFFLSSKLVTKCFLFCWVDILVGDLVTSAGCSIFVQQIVFIHPTLTWKVLQQADAPAVSKTIYQSFFEKHFLMTSTFFWVGWGWGWVFFSRKNNHPHIFRLEEPKSLGGFSFQERSARSRHFSQATAPVKSPKEVHLL